MFGYASNETDVLMPAPITYAHRLVERQAQVRKSGTLPWLRPDAKSQITFRYDDNKIAGLMRLCCQPSTLKISHRKICMKR